VKGHTSLDERAEPAHRHTLQQEIFRAGTAEPRRASRTGFHLPAPLAIPRASSARHAGLVSQARPEGRSFSTEEAPEGVSIRAIHGDPWPDSSPGSLRARMCHEERRDAFLYARSPDRAGRAAGVIGEVVESMGESFTTLDFIAGCPNSGGTKSGKGCPVVRSRKSRSVCGRSLAGWQGLDDLFVGAPYNDDGGSDAGEVYLIFSHL